MDYKETFKEYSRRLGEEIRSDGFRFDFLSRFVVVWTLLSRIPLPRSLWPKEPVEGSRALALAPLVGGALGIMAGAAAAAANALGLSAYASSWLAVTLYFLTGWSLHIDGWGDFWDGVGSGKTGTELRAVMKDSRLGSYGGAAVIVAFGLWTALLSSIEPGSRIAACMTSGACARFSEDAAAMFGEYPWEEGMSKGWVDAFTPYDLFISALCLLPFAPFAPMRFLMSAAAAAVIGYIFAKRMNKILGGVNGDVMGASAVACELTSLLIWAAIK